MSTSTVTEHDRQQACAADRVVDYVQLSRSCAARDDGRGALLAMWAADIAVLQSLLWESGLGSGPDPDAQLAAVSQAVSASLSLRAETVGAAMTLRQSLEVARQAMVDAFDDSVHATLAARLASLDHLDSVSAPAVDEADHSRERRLAGRHPEMLVADLELTAADCMAVATAMVDEGDFDGATSFARQADLASFEAYLVATALRVGDDGLVTVDLRWNLAAAGDRGEVRPVVDCHQVIDEFRDHLVGAVGPSEDRGVREYFEPLPPRRQ